MADARLFYCQGCNEHWPSDSFEFLIDKNGRQAPRKQCRVCNGSLGHKKCFTCREDKPIAKFKKEYHKGRQFPLSYNRNCWTCIYARRKELGTSKHPKKKLYAKEIGPRRLASGKLPTGWTPPPTAEQLAAIHRRYSPPRSYVESMLRGEQSA